MSRNYFKSTGDWRLLCEQMEKMRDGHMEEALSGAQGPTADIILAQREYHRGFYEALKWVLGLPDEVLKEEGDSEKEEAVEEKGNVETKRLVPERPPPPRKISRIF